jgi:protein-S-isoprenylcysteine O-methyltransferase Ste14
MGMWLVPTSTTSHLMLSIGMTLYILVGLYFEEKDLISEFGLRYSEYRQRVAKLIPFIA